MRETRTFELERECEIYHSIIYALESAGYHIICAIVTAHWGSPGLSDDENLLAVTCTGSGEDFFPYSNPQKETSEILLQW